MKTSKAIIFLLIFSSFLIETACKQTVSHDVNSVKSINVTDFRGKEISISKPATRIVCLIESALSGLYMLNAENRIVGVPSAVYNESTAAQYAVLDQRIRDKQLDSPGNWDFLSLEKLIALQPDLVVIWASQQEAIEAIEEKGIPVYSVFLKSFDDVYKEIDDLGKLTGTSPRADSIISFTKNEVTGISLKSTGNQRKSVYFMWSQGLLETSGTTSTVNELIELAGAKNACRQPQEHIIINLENLLQWNPDVIVMWNQFPKNPDNILNMAELQHLHAVKHNMVYELPPVFWCDLWTLKFQLAAKHLANYCNATDSGKFNLDKEKQKMVMALYGKKGEGLIK